jgi:hypothetical protein
MTQLPLSTKGTWTTSKPTMMRVPENRYQPGNLKMNGIMTNALNSLRVELNRERAYVRSTRINILNGAEVSYVTKICSELRWQNVVMLRKAIKELKKVKKPVYKWLPSLD